MYNIPMRILVSNDDGIYSTGIRSLSEGLVKEGHEVYVVAPDRERSATGHSLTLHRPLRVDEVTHLDGVTKAYCTDGTPSDCVKFGVEAVMDDKPDLVLSGINHGPNMGSDILYSGTVSAAMEGAIFNIPSIALSLADHKAEDFTAAVIVTNKILSKIKELDFPPKTLINVNIPPLPISDIVGIQVAELGIRPYDDHFEKRVDPRGKVYYWLAGEAIEDEELPGTDVYAVRQNLVSITPITIHMTNDEMKTALSSWASGIKLG